MVGAIKIFLKFFNDRINNMYEYSFKKACIVMGTTGLFVAILLEIFVEHMGYNFLSLTTYAVYATVSIGIACIFYEKYIDLTFVVFWLLTCVGWSLFLVGINVYFYGMHVYH